MTQREANANPRGTPIGIVGDRNPIEHGGGIIYRKSGDRYSMVYFQPYTVEFPLDSVSIYEFDIEDNVYQDLNWVDWDKVATNIGMDTDELIGHTGSSNVFARASVYEAVGSYYGFREFDEPREMTTRQAEGKFGRTVDAAHRAENKRRAKKNPSPNLKSKLLR